MKKIKLTQNKYTIVDDNLYALLNQWKWYALKDADTGRFYARRQQKINGKRRAIIMARFIMGLEYNDKRKVDHINHNTLDNRKENLRICTNAENGRNRTSNIGASQYKGVSRSKKRWMARITLNWKRIYLGTFESEIDAAKAYNKAALKYYGEYAYLNKM